MTGRNTTVLCMLIGLWLAMVGAAQAANLATLSTPTPLTAGNDAVYPVQTQTITPAPQPTITEQVLEPGQSEVGRDLGLVVGALLLVLIVIGGVIYGLKRQTPAKARD